MNYFFKHINIIIILIIPFFTFGQWTQIGNDIDGESINDQSGYSVSISADGNIVAIGGRTNSDNGSASGHLRVYENIAGNWTQKGNDIDGIAASDRFGSSVSLSADGNTVAVGAPDNNDNGFESGHVRIFEFQSNDWIQIGDEIAGEVFSDHSGFSVSLSDDGSYVAIGAPDNGVTTGEGSNFGHVRVYENQSNNWVQIGDDIDGEAVEDKSGNSVSLNADGSIVAIGAHLNDGTAPGAGHVRVYRNESGSWEQLGSDIDGEATNDRFGSSVSLNNEGNILAVGAIDNNGIGHVRIFENQSDTWIQIGSDIDGEAIEDDFGISVSLSAEGNILAVGAYRNNGFGGDAGHVRIYKNISNVWEQVDNDIDGEAIQDRSGGSVSLSADGSIVAVGAYLNDGNGANSGHVRVFSNANVFLDVESNNFNHNFSIYPNPVKTYVTIDLGEIYATSKIKIYDILGKLIDVQVNGNKRIINIDTKHYQKGLYFIEIESEKMRDTLKFVKQ